MAFIANRPVRFDRNYQIGEVIPDKEIDPRMVARLISMGRIICVDLPTEGNAETPPDNAGNPTEGESEAEGINAQVDTENSTEDESDGTEGNAETETEDAGETKEFKCAVCGKTFKSQNALASHSRTHKK